MMRKIVVSFTILHCSAQRLFLLALRMPRLLCSMFLCALSASLSLPTVKALPPQQLLAPLESSQAAGAEESTNLPLVVWHGLGDK